MFSSSKYYKLSTKPVTVNDLKKPNKKSKSVSPITKESISKKDIQQEYYSKYGIIYTGNDLSSCVNSLF